MREAAIVSTARGGGPCLFHRGFQVAGRAPGEMGIASVLAIPRLLGRAGLRGEDIELWGINGAFASQAL